MAKGSSFERVIAKQLSRWWSDGKRDDIFWRVSQSGGRATQRTKSGKRTYGSYGDIAAIDPIGEPLLKLFTIELKVGRQHRGAGEMIDAKPSRLLHPFAKCLLQARQAHIDAQSKSWMLIGKKDFKQAIAYVEWSAFFALNARLGTSQTSLFHPPVARFSITASGHRLSFAALSLDLLLKRLPPSLVVRYLSA